MTSWYDFASSAAASAYSTVESYSSAVLAATLSDDESSARPQKTLQLSDSITREGNQQTTLICRGQEIGILPTALSKLRALKVLDFSDNVLWEMPPRLLSLKGLEICTLSANHITTIPAEIGKMEALTELYLSFNRLTELPESIRHLVRLKVRRTL